MIGNLLASDLNELVWEFLLSGGVFMLLIVLCSLVAAAIVIHRFLSLRREAVMPRDLLAKLREAPQPLDKGQTEALRAEAVESESALGEIACAALSEDCDSADEATNTTEAVAREEVLRLQSGLAILEDVITIAPLLGLLGTVSGLVGVFAELGDSTTGGADPEVLAAGIARALNTTIAGLAVAVPTVVARSYFHKKIEGMAVRMEILFGRLIHARYRKGSDSDSDLSSSEAEEHVPVATAPAPSSMDKYQPPLAPEPVAVAEDRPLSTPPPSPASLDELPVLPPTPTIADPVEVAGQPGVANPASQPGAQSANVPAQRSVAGGRIVPQPIPPGGGGPQQAQVPTEKPGE
jgi:biopolymer transport protein ExbB